jgi:deoxyribonuclease V
VGGRFDLHCHVARILFSPISTDRRGAIWQRKRKNLMHIEPLHDWALTPKEAVALQRKLAGRIDSRSRVAKCELIAGADVSYSRFSNLLYAGVVVLRMGDLSAVERRGATFETRFPYVPGLLSFREAPALLKVFSMLESEPDVVVCDGHGFAHPRRFGLACHVGLWLNRPTLGCAKSRLTGTFKRLGQRAESRTPLTDDDEIIGAVVRTKRAVKPVFVSTGHCIDLESAVKIILAARAGYRIPEPTRLADQYVNALRRKELATDEHR